ncbi:MAG: SDR family oxidoreductase [Chloroflexi bacterium]|nr:SDR family oxidoreductase [Chloroflexota bacterium]
MVPKVALVTGGASGMGKIFAQRMAGHGTRVAILDTNDQELQRVASQSDNLYSYHCDVSNLDEVSQVVGKVTEELGTVDRLVHCAAIMPTAKLDDQDIAQIQKLMTINYGGMVNISKIILADMKQRQSGEIVIFGSLGGSVLVPECGAYCASKAAVNAYTEILIEENRGSGVHIMLVCPTLVNTPLLQQAVETSNPKNIRDSIKKNRLADPDSIIDSVERGLKKKTEILLPNTEAKILSWLRRLAPRLLWRLIHHTNKE